jgi:Ca2+/Na+ antiporter
MVFGVCIIIYISIDAQLKYLQTLLIYILYICTFWLLKTRIKINQEIFWVQNEAQAYMI